MPRFRWIPILCVLTVLAGHLSPLQAQEKADEATVVFLVRHAEKATDDPDDPGLTSGGLERAEALARLLSDARLTRVFTTDYRRTRQTAAPTAEAQDLRPMVYDPRDLRELAERIRSTAGRHLVVGHSNTTPEVVRLLGGEPGEPIDEAEEYDRLYVLTLGSEGTVTTTVLRYGPG